MQTNNSTYSNSVSSTTRKPDFHTEKKPDQASDKDVQSFNEHMEEEDMRKKRDKDKGANERFDPRDLFKNFKKDNLKKLLDKQKSADAHRQLQNQQDQQPGLNTADEFRALGGEDVAADQILKAHIELGDLLKAQAQKSASSHSASAVQALDGAVQKMVDHIRTNEAKLGAGEAVRFMLNDTAVQGTEVRLLKVNGILQIDFQTTFAGAHTLLSERSQELLGKLEKAMGVQNIEIKVHKPSATATEYDDAVERIMESKGFSDQDALT